MANEVVQKPNYPQQDDEYFLGPKRAKSIPVKQSSICTEIF